MRKVGGIIALTAGILGVCGAAFTLVFGGLGASFKAADADTVFGLWWGGLAFSFLTIILGAVTMGSEGRVPGALLVVCAIAGAFWGGPVVAIFMALAAAGGMLAVVRKRKMTSPQKMIRSESWRTE